MRLSRERSAMLVTMGTETFADTLHSMVIRYWRGLNGDVRGMLINVVTQEVFPFKSLVDLHEVLTKAVQENSNTQREEK